MKVLFLSAAFVLLAPLVAGVPAPAAPIDQAAGPGEYDRWNKRAAPIDQAAGPGGYDRWNKERAAPIDQAAGPGGYDRWNKRG
jgi:hypothetical protein